MNHFILSFIWTFLCMYAVCPCTRVLRTTQGNDLRVSFWRKVNSDLLKQVDHQQGQSGRSFAKALLNGSSIKGQIDHWTDFRFKSS